MTLSGLLDSLFLSLKYSSPTDSKKSKGGVSDKSLYTHMSMIDQNSFECNNSAKDLYNEYIELGLLKTANQVGDSRKSVEKEKALTKIRKGKV